ncbi:MAG: hemerythrin domain-containing protein [Alphaproteobacteria bacterium]|nr:hemerythrin domain-containing protein [Alphaproteobacteria bacterium]
MHGKLYIPEVLKLGILSIDDEHSALVAKLNEGIQLLEHEKANSDKFQALLLEFIDMTEDHFRHEEVFMEEKGYDKLEEHKSEHEHILILLRHFANQTEHFEANELIFCFTQVINDIVYSDMLFANFLEITPREVA